MKSEIDQKLSYDEKDPTDIERWGKRLEHHGLAGTKGIKPIPMKLLAGPIGAGNRGGFGRALEKYYYGIDPGNDIGPDFPLAGVELKSTPLVNGRDGHRCKERLVLGIIDYGGEPGVVFEKSHVMKKCGLLMLVSYLHSKDTAVGELKIVQAKLVDLKKDIGVQAFRQIKRDWAIIMQKIRQGKAHELSGGDTLFLEACTKASDATKRKTYAGNLEAKPRAFAFKPKFVLSHLIGEIPIDSERIVEGTDAPTENALDEKVGDRFGAFIAKTVTEIAQAVAPDIDPTHPRKDVLSVIARAILGTRKKRILEFEEADILMKTIRVDRHGMPKEHMSFPKFDHMRIVNERWEDTDDPPTIRQAIEKRFLFVIFQYKDDEETLVLRDAFFWKMPFADREKMHELFDKTRHMIRTGHADALPGEKDNSVGHVRPHARDGKDKEKTPKNGMQVKKCFWLNKQYLKQQIDRAGK